MADLIRSIEFSQDEVEDLKTEVKELRKTNNEKQAVIEEIQLRCAEMEQRQNY